MKSASAAMGATPLTETQLWARIQEVYRSANAVGAAQGITTTQITKYDSDLDVNFIIYIAEALKNKPKSPERTEYAKFESPFSLRDAHCALCLKL